MSGRLRALLLLAFALVTTTLRRMFGRGPRGLPLVERNFAEDRLASLTLAGRADLAAFGGCIACGRCDDDDGPRRAASRGAYPGTMALVLATTRSLPERDAAAESLRWVDDAALAAKERRCPTGVPLRRLAAFVAATGTVG